MLYIDTMDKQQAIRHFGSSAALARALGITRAAVTNWGERVPPLRQWELEVLTEGALKAERRDAELPTLASGWSATLPRGSRGQ